MKYSQVVVAACIAGASLVSAAPIAAPEQSLVARQLADETAEDVLSRRDNIPEADRTPEEHRLSRRGTADFFDNLAAHKGLAQQDKVKKEQYELDRMSRRWKATSPGGPSAGGLPTSGYADASMAADPSAGGLYRRDVDELHLEARHIDDGHLERRFFQGLKTFGKATLDTLRGRTVKPPTSSGGLSTPSANYGSTPTGGLDDYSGGGGGGDMAYRRRSLDVNELDELD